MKQKLTLSNKFDNFKARVKKDLTKILTAYFILLLVAFVFLLIDALTKQAFFNVNSETIQGKVLTSTPWIPVPSDSNLAGANNLSYPLDYVVKLRANSAQTIQNNTDFLAIRSIWHGGVTVLPFIQADQANIYLIHFLSFAFVLVAIIAPLFIQNYRTIFAIGLGLVVAGSLGNEIDRIDYHGYVRDIFYMPFYESWTGKSVGTFNFADVSIYAAIGVLMLGFILLAVKEARLAHQRSLAKQKDTTEIDNQLLAQLKSGQALAVASTSQNALDLEKVSTTEIINLSKQTAAKKPNSEFDWNFIVDVETSKELWNSLNK
ncbi:signal peptidase II [Mycoplasma corogypsi]|uniref:signal peptidase II n=1 Tax=Mycoplasma corogypsi TaxID=2106 RepID=UPI00387327CE